MKHYFELSYIIISLAVLILFTSSIYTNYDLDKWSNKEERRGMILLHQFDNLSVPELQNNTKCINDEFLVFHYHGDKAIFRCGGVFFPFYDEIAIDKKVVEEAYRLSTGK